MKKISIKSIIIFIAVAGLLIFLHFIRVLAPIESGVYTVLNKIGEKFYSISSKTKSVYKNQVEKKELLLKINSLENKVKELMVENSRLNKIEEENGKLRQHLKFLKDTEYNYVLAGVVAKQIFLDLEESKSNIIINKGKKDGIFPGSIVIDNGVVVGKIIDSEENISHVAFITNSHCKLAATLQNEKKTLGATVGNLGLTVVMNFIPQTEKVEVGNLVVTSGLEKDIPRGLLIGEIVKVNKENNDIWQSATIEPIVNFDDLTTVLVLLP